VALMRRWLPVVAWAGIVSTLSSGWFSGERTSALLLPLFAALFPDAPPEHLDALHQAARKLAHFAEYLVLSVLLYHALRGPRRWDLRAGVIAVGLAGLYAVGDEFHQWFVPGRTAAGTDCLIDVSGAAAGQGILAARARAGR
jgi:VanZ family protein